MHNKKLPVLFNNLFNFDEEWQIGLLYECNLFFIEKLIPAIIFWQFFDGDNLVVD